MTQASSQSEIPYAQPREEIFALLRADHQKLSQLLTRMTQDVSDALQEQKRLLPELRLLLVAHLEAERDVVYHTLERIADTRELALEFDQESVQIIEWVDRLSSLVGKDSEDPSEVNELRTLWEETLWELKEAVDAHRAEAESETFAQMREHVSPHHLERLAVAFRQAEKRGRSVAA